MQPEQPDYYELLQVSRRAHPMMVTRAFRLLVAFYHPDNKETGDEAIFRAVLEAYRVLSDPVRRAAYDRVKFSMSHSGGERHAAGADSGRDRMPVDERHLRRLILTALYDVRRSRPYKPMMPILAIAELFGRSMEELQFSLWYLRGKKFIEMPDGSDITITIAGVDEVEGIGNGAGRPGMGDELEMISLPAASAATEAAQPEHHTTGQISLPGERTTKESAPAR